MGFFLGKAQAMNEQESLKEYIDNTIKNGGEIRIINVEEEFSELELDNKKDILSMQMKEGPKN